jgi:hypothetical protein
MEDLPERTFSRTAEQTIKTPEDGYENRAGYMLAIAADRFYDLRIAVQKFARNHPTTILNIGLWGLFLLYHILNYASVISGNED